MGIDFTALLDHTLTAEQLCGLPRSLDDLALSEILGDSGSSRSWQIRLLPPYTAANEILQDERNLDLDGPAGLALTVSYSLAELTHTARWYSFLSDHRIRDQLQESARLVGGVLGSSAIVYLPDSGYEISSASDAIYEESDMSVVLRELQRMAGPPAADILSILREDGDTWSGDGYFVEELTGRPAA